MYKVFLFAIVIFLHSGFGAASVFSQCGPDGKQSCSPTKPKNKKKGTTPPPPQKKKKIPKVIPKPKVQPVPKSEKPYTPPEKQKPKRKKRNAEVVPNEKKRGAEGGAKVSINQAELIARWCSDPAKLAVLSANSARPLAALSRGKMFLAKGDQWGKAINEFTTALKFNPCLSEAYYSRAYALGKNFGNVDDVIKDYSYALQVDKKYTDAYHNRAMLLFDHKMEIELALKDLDAAIAENPDTIAKIYTSRGNVNKFVREYDLANIDFKSAIDFDPNFFPAYYYRGIAHLTDLNLNYDVAIRDCKKANELIEAAKLDPMRTQAESYNFYDVDNLGLKAKQCVKDAETKKNTYDGELAKLKSDGPEGFRARGDVHRNHRNFDLAIKEYETAIRSYLDMIASNPTFPKAGLKFAYFNRGLALIEKKEYDKAIEDYNEIVGSKPDDSGLEKTWSDAWCKRGIAYAGKGEYEKAISDYNEAIRLSEPTVTDAFYRRGLAYINIGKLEAAAADLDKFLGHDNLHQLAYLKLAFVYDQMRLNETDSGKRASYEEKAIDLRKKAKDPKASIKKEEKNNP